MAEIFLVEDDESIRELVLYALNNGGHHGIGVCDSTELWKLLADQTPDLVMLDIMLPGDDGFRILEQLKSTPRTEAVPVIMLTAKVNEYDKVRALDAGADDYMTKPFGVMELLSRVRAVLRRTAPHKADLLRTAAIILDEARHTVSVHGQSVTLTFKEFELLSFLMRNAGLVLSREKIMERVWGFDYEGESRTVDMHIKTLRQKLGEAGNVIETVRGVGYKIGGTE